MNKRKAQDKRDKKSLEESQSLNKSKRGRRANLKEVSDPISETEKSSDEDYVSDENNEKPTKRLKADQADDNKVDSGTDKKSSQKVECVAIRYMISDPDHPFQFLKNKLDRTPINDIIGINETVFKQDVSFTCVKKLNFIFEFLKKIQLIKGTMIQVMRNDFPVDAVIEHSIIFRLDFKAVNIYLIRFKFLILYYNFRLKRVLLIYQNLLSNNTKSQKLT